ncbi:MAG: lamin tail domain-containing protein [Verrucomicrobiota bacterium]
MNRNLPPLGGGSRQAAAAGLALLGLLIPGAASAQELPPRITEILAANNGSFSDGGGANPDWIEIHNPNSADLDLSGWHLTDDAGNPVKFTFPAGTVLKAQEYRVIAASGETAPLVDADGFLHATFSLAKEGEYLALVSPDFSLVQAITPAFPPQYADVSWGEAPAGVEGPASGYFLTPTPGKPNTAAAVAGLSESPVFSREHGYFTSPFSVALSTATGGGAIFYTTDGTPPSAAKGTLYAGPLTVSTTTTLRAVTVRDGFAPSAVSTRTFLRVDDIVRQTRPAAYPTKWAGQPADYDMDPDIVDRAAYSGQFQEAFAALPTLSLVFDPDAFFHATKGIYQQPQNQGKAWERPVSAELIVPDGSEPGFQIDAGVRVQGGSSRNADTPKHSLSLRFRKEYGGGKLEYPLFRNAPHGDTAASQFDYLQLRPEYNFGWMHRHWYQARYALYGRDQWASDLFQSMGNPGAHGRWVHLFLNGLYWGLHAVHERPDKDFMENYFGGKSADYDTVNSGEVTDGNLTAFNAMMNLAYGGIQTAAAYESIGKYLDLDSFIDYIILNNYIGNQDWDSHNWRAARKREAGAGYRFFPWDSEFGISQMAGGVFTNPPDFKTVSLGINITGKNTDHMPTGLHQRLSLNAEYRLRFADRLRKHFFNGGALTPEKTAAAWRARAAGMDAAIIAESARWGDFRRDVSPGQWSRTQFDLYTRDDHYRPLIQWLYSSYLPQRSGVVLNQFKVRKLYPVTEAPEFSQPGGTVSAGFKLTITGPPAATLYITTDGSDPRLAGGNPSPQALSPASGEALTLEKATTVKARARAASGDWSALTSAVFQPAGPGLRLTEIMYHPAGDELAEFLEITNAGTVPLSLAGLHFTQGITFDFDLHSSLHSLAAGERLLIVRNPAAFQAAQGHGQDAKIAGVFQNDTGLANSGETLTLSDAGGGEVFSVTYSDAFPWPAEADGNGASLVLSSPAADLADPLSWRASLASGGNPGTSDSLPPGGTLLTDYLIGSPGISIGREGENQSSTGIGSASASRGILISFIRRPGADHLSHVVESSSGLQHWSPAAAVLVSRLSPAPGQEVLTYRALPELPVSQFFVRLAVRTR